MNIDPVQEDTMIQCALCGKMFPTDEIRPDYNSDIILCEECSAEKNSCGCSDEEIPGSGK